MARFRKVVTTADTYTVADEKGNRHEQTLTQERLAKWAATFAKLRKKGYNIPVPVDHDMLSGVPSLQMGSRGVPSANSNGGFLESLVLGTDTDANGVTRPALIAEMEIPGDETNENSLAFKVGKTIKDTSIYVRPNYIDGTGEIHEEAPMHVALVLHPIEPGQKNFIPIQKGDLSIAMSQRIAMGNLSPVIGETDDEDDDENPDAGEPAESSVASGGSIVSQILKELRNTEINIDLPDDTNESNFLDRLLVASRQRNKQPKPIAPGPQQPPGQQMPPQQPPTSLTKPPRNAVEQPASLAMSVETKTPEQQIAILMSQVEGYKAGSQLLANYVNTLEAEKRAARIAALVSSGRVTQDYADAHLAPQLTGFQMSIGADGKPAQAPIDTLLVALEAVPARTGSVHGSMVGLPQSLFDNLPLEAQEAVASVLMSMGGNPPAGSREEAHPNGGFFNRPNAPLDGAAASEVANQFLQNTKS